MAKDKKQPEGIKATELDPCLRTLTKGEETIMAHPNQVALWVEQGWVVVEDTEPTEDAE